MTTAITTMNAPPASSVAFHVPNLAVSRRARTTAPIRNATDSTTMIVYRNVRCPIVSPWPMAGGLAGYFRNGTRYRLRKPAPATRSASTRGRSELWVRRWTMMYATAKKPPIARPYRTIPVPMPAVRWIPRLKTSAPSGSTASPAALRSAFWAASRPLS